MKRYINEENIIKAIKSNMGDITEEQLQRLTRRILMDASPLVSMLVRQNIINERRSMLEQLRQS